MKRAAFAFLLFSLTSAIVWVGVAFGRSFVPLCKVHPSATRTDMLADMAAWDAEWYVGIARDGYSFDRNRNSNVAFYPAAPLTAGFVSRVMGIRPEAALVLCSHVFLFCAFVLLGEYVRLRFPDSQGLDALAMLALGLYPVTIYFRMAYTESLFVFVCLLALYAMERRWSLLAIAFLVGLATATRAVGVALAVPFAIHIWQISASGRQFLARCAALCPIGCWGLLAYMTYQWIAFGEPFAFIQTQVHWNHRPPAANLLELAERLGTAEPILAVYDPSQRGYWAKWPPENLPIFNLVFANPIYFAVGIILVSLGGFRRWLNAKEITFGIIVILIPYLTHADRACMAGEARYSSAVIPIYLVLAHLLWRLPPPVAALLSVSSANFLAIYAALFVSWYWFY
jgi:hypothetical protein